MSYYYNFNGITETGFKILVEKMGKLEEIQSQKGPFIIDQWQMSEVGISVEPGSLIRVKNLLKLNLEGLNLKKKFKINLI